MNIILFDGVCNLCNSVVSFLIKYDRQNNLHFAAQQLSAGQKLMLQHAIATNNNSVVFIKNEKVYFKSDAIIEIAKLLSGWPKLLMMGVVLPKFFRDGLYDIIANNRYKLFGKRAICSMPSKATENKFIV